MLSYRTFASRHDSDRVAGAVAALAQVFGAINYLANRFLEKVGRPNSGSDAINAINAPAEVTIGAPVARVLSPQAVMPLSASAGSRTLSFYGPEASIYAALVAISNQTASAEVLAGLIRALFELRHRLILQAAKDAEERARADEAFQAQLAKDYHRRQLELDAMQKQVDQLLAELRAAQKRLRTAEARLAGDVPKDVGELIYLDPARVAARRRVAAAAQSVRALRQQVSAAGR